MRKLDYILLIDDNPADNEFHELVIQDADITWKLESITDSRKALAYFKQALTEDDSTLPDLVFLDINMPAITGFELLDKLREIPDPMGKLQKTKIFMLSGSQNPDDFSRAEEKYNDLIRGFRIKPLTDTIFMDIIQKHFSND